MLTANPVLSESQVGCASGWVREHPDVEINSDVARFLRDVPAPTPDVKATKLLAALAKLYPTPGEPISISFPDLPSLLSGRAAPSGLGGSDLNHSRALALTAAAWAANSNELWFLLVDYLADSEKCVIRVGQGDRVFRISPKGWTRLAGANPNSRVGFIAMWIDARLNPLFAAIEKGISDAGYAPERIDKVEHNNRIDDEIIAHIRRSRFIVADMTGNRGGVYFESGFALGLGLEVIWLCRKGRLNRVHFDNRQYNFIEWSFDDLPDLTKRLTTRIEARFGRPS
jgi:hypothetical protein